MESRNLERDWFEIDRRNVDNELNGLRRRIECGATELAMVAAERVFEPRLSARLARTARATAAAADRV
jgi:hypothetical protein